MLTNKTPVTWPLSAEEWRAVERAAHQERARAMVAVGRSVKALARRAFGADRPVNAYLPTATGGHFSS